MGLLRALVAIGLTCACAVSAGSIMIREVVISSKVDANAAGLSVVASTFSWQPTVLNILVCRPKGPFETVFSIYYRNPGGSILEVNFPPDETTDAGFSRIVLRVSRDILTTTEVSITDFDKERPVADHRMNLAFIEREIPVENQSVYESKCVRPPAPPAS